MCFKKTLVLSIVWKDKKILKKEELIEVLKIIDLFKKTKCDWNIKNMIEENIG